MILRYLNLFANEFPTYPPHILADVKDNAVALHKAIEEAYPEIYKKPAAKTKAKPRTRKKVSE